MEEAAAVRGAALDAVDDVEPDRLRERICERLENGSMAPGALTVLSARAAERSGTETVDSVSTAATAERGAGVQLIYEGLRLTRRLSQDPPWTQDGVTGGDAPTTRTERTDGGDVRLSDADGVTVEPTAARDADIADMDILVADVMVARGFYLLARTEAADEAVSVVRSFGGDQTRLRTTGDKSFDGNLERNVLELAAVAGATAAGGEAPPTLRSYAADLAGTSGRLPLADGLFTDGTTAALADQF